MAKWGEGDPRWIVEERPDSTNVNNWHWTERNATSWSKVNLKKMFLEIKEETDEGSWAIDEVKSMEGEAMINNRKGKLIFFYEWDIKLNYKGKVADSELDHTGTIHIPNLSDENTADDVDVAVSAKGDSKNATKLKDIVRKNGMKLCREKCQKYINDLRTEYTTGMVLPTKHNIKKNDTKQQNSEVNKSMKKMQVNEKKTEKKISCHISVNLTEEFRTSADQLFATLTTPERLSAFTGSQCHSNPKINGEFSIMNGNIIGSYVEIKENEKIVQKWRFKEWPKDVFSTVTMTLEEKSDHTLLTLTQTGVPDYDTNRTEMGWKQHFWGPIKQVFGFGAQLY